MNVERKFTALKDLGRQCSPLSRPVVVSGSYFAPPIRVVYRKAASDLFKPCHFYRVVSLFLIPALTSGLIASDASSPVVIGSWLHVFRRQFVTVFAVIRQRLVSNMFRSRYSYGPVSQLFRLNRGVGLSVALATQRNQIIEMIASAQSARDSMMNVKTGISLLNTRTLLKLPSTILTLIAIALTRPSGLLKPIRAMARARFPILMKFYSNGFADTQSIGPTTVGAKTKITSPRRVHLHPLLTSLTGLNYTNHARIALTFIGAEPRRPITVIGKVLSAAMRAISRQVSPLITEIAETRAVLSVLWFPRNGLVTNLAVTAHFHGHFTKIMGEAVR